MDHDREPFSMTISDTARGSRRLLLGRLAALPAAFGLGIFAERESGEAKKGKGKKGSGKNKNRNKKKDKNTNGGGGGYSPDSEERAFLDLINDYRRKNGAGNLSLQNQLGAAADHHSQDMANKNYFSHQLSNGDSAEKNIERFGYTNWSFIGENIAAGQETANEVMEAWKSSPDHDKGMRNKNFTEIGIGRAYNKNSKYGWYWTTTFGSQ
ncbi:MAG: CAP domain-containing protein [Chloroflexi bacterium]|nr:CAP domain-containing protein [Chloroflexota bacterium]